MTTRRHLVAALLILAAVAAAPIALSGYWVAILTQAAIFGLAAASLDVAVGFTGLVSLGHAAFLGLAGYSAALTVTRLGADPWVASAVGVVVPVAVALAFGPLAIRTRGIYFLVITLAFGQVLWGAAVKWTDLTGGYNGIPGVSRPRLFGSWLESTAGFHLFTVAIVALGIGLLHRFVNSPVGLALRGARSNPTRLAMLGYNPDRYRLAGFCVAAAAGGIAGILNAFFLRFVGPDMLVWTGSAQLLLMVILGGTGTLWGAAAAGALLTIARTMVINQTPRWVMVLGLLYVATVLIAPHGWFRAGGRAARALGGRGPAAEHPT